MKNLIVMPDGSEISSGPGMKTAIKRMTITEMVNDKDDLSLGSACANSVEMSIIAPEGLAITAGDEIALYRVDGENRIPNGVYIVENPTQVSSYTVKLTAFDRVVKLDKDLTQWLSGLDAWPYTLLDFARIVCEECGLELVTGGWIPNAYFPVRKFAKSGVTGRKLMRWIGEVCARFVRATADGKIEFAWYAPTGVTIAPTGGNYYFSGSFSKEKYAVAPIDSVHIRFANSEAGYLWPELEDASANIYAISDNPFLSSISEDTSDDFSEALELIRDELEGVTYTPCKVSVPASYGIKAGQIVDILSKDGTAITTYVMKSTTSGHRTSLECTGSARRDSTTAVNNKTPTEAAKDVLLGETPQEVFDRLTGMSKDQGIYMEDGKIYINGEFMKIGTIASRNGGVMIDMDNGVSSLARGVSAEFESASWDDVLLPEIADFILSEADKMADNTIKDLAIRIPEGVFGAAIVALYKYTDINGTLKLFARFMWNDGSISHMSASKYGSGAWSWTGGSPAMAWSSPSAPNEIISNGVGAMSFYDPSGNDVNTWVNPPMYLGFEYRTTELWGGKPVYTQMVYLGYLTGTNKAVNVGVDYTKVIDLKVIAYGSGFATVLPMYGGGNIYAYAFMQGTSVAVSIPRDSSTNYAYAVIKYTK